MTERHEQPEQAVTFGSPRPVSLPDLDRSYREIFDNTPAVIYVKSIDGRYEFINRRFEELFHVTRSQIIGRSDLDIFPEHLAEAFRKNDRHVAETGEVLNTEEIAPHSDGPHTYVSVKFPLRDENGTIRAVAGISTDLTERIRAEEQADSLSRRLALILRAVGDGIYGVDAGGLLTFMNPMAERLLGWTEQELLGRPIHDYIDAGGRGNLRQECPADAALWEGVVFAVDDGVFFRKDGSPLRVEYISTPIRDGDRIIGAVVTFRDASERMVRDRIAKLEVDAQQRRLQIVQQLRGAREVQREMFPKANPQIRGFDIAGCSHPKELVSGDFYDYVSLDDGSLIIIVADASGHDLAAAIQTVEAHAAVHAYLDCGLPLDELLRKLNRMLARHLKGRFVSLFLARLLPEKREFQFAGAGHDAMVLRANGEDERLQSTGLVLGFDAEADVPEFRTARLEPGDMVVLATDGFLEAMSPNQERFGRERIISTLREDPAESSSKLLARLYPAALVFSGPRPQADDMTAVIVRAVNDA